MKPWKTLLFCCIFFDKKNHLQIIVMPVCYCKSLNKISRKTQPEENAIEHSKILVRSLCELNERKHKVYTILTFQQKEHAKFWSQHSYQYRNTPRYIACSPTEMGRDLLLATFRFSELWPGLPVSVSTSSAPGTACSAKCETRQISANINFMQRLRERE